MTRSTKIASPKDRKYLESLNLKALQKSRPKGDQDPKEYYKALQEEATKGPLFNDKVLDTVEHLPDLPKPVSKWLGNMDDKELGKIDAQDLRLIIDWVRGSEDADIDGLSWDDAMEAQQNWHDQLHDNKEDCGEYETHKVVFSTGGYEFVDLTTDHDLQVEGCKLKHCVGGRSYCLAVSRKHSRIISMRNGKNEPLVTIQYLINDKSVAQCYGYRNHPPAKKLNEPLVKFFEHMKWYDGIFLLKNYTVTRDKLERIIAYIHDTRRLIRLLETTTDPGVLEVLAGHSEWHVREAVANKPQTTPHVLDELARDEDMDVVYAVAYNDNTQPDTIRFLYNQYGNGDMLWILAQNANLPDDVASGLAQHDDYNARRHLATNPKTSQDVLNILVNTGDDRIAKLVAENTDKPDMLRILSEYADRHVRIAVAKNPHTPVAILEAFSTSDDSRIVAGVAGNTSTPARLLEVLADDKDGDVRWYVTQNPNTPKPVLQQLVADNNYAISEAAEDKLALASVYKSAQRYPVKHVASPKDRKYLESLNLKSLQKSTPRGDQDPKEYYRSLQEEATKGPLFQKNTLDTVEHLPDMPKPVTKWIGNMPATEAAKLNPDTLRNIIDWVNGDDTADIEHMTWDEANQAQEVWHESVADNKDDCGEYQIHNVIYSAGGYDFTEITTDHDLKVEGCKLKHCVGGSGYCNAVRNKQSRIVSMRNSKNEPLVTIEYNTTKKVVTQAFGYKNHTPSKKLTPTLLKFFKHMKWDDGMRLLQGVNVPTQEWVDMLNTLRSKWSREYKESLRQRIPNDVLHILLDQHMDADAIYAILDKEYVPADTISKIVDKLPELNEEDYEGHAINMLLLHDNIKPQDVKKLLGMYARSRETKYRVNVDTLRKLAGFTSNVQIMQIIADQGDDINHLVGFALTHNSKVPESILEQLSTNADYYVRLAVAECKRTPVHVLETLAEDEDPTVRSGLVRMGVPKHVLEKLMNDEDVHVRMGARQILKKEFGA